MTRTILFYDLETSGFNPREARIMQFAGQRTTLDLEPIGSPVNVLIKLNEDILPDPQAILVTSITPQKTIAEGITEVDFLKIFHEDIAVPGTIFVGYNNVRFDDEFMRFLHYRNFYDPYEWQWQNDRGRWDLLDVVRMTRALRPKGIKWPFDIKGQPTNRLESITNTNKLDHRYAHDALNDVLATIEVAKMILTKQSKLFEFLLKARDKKVIAEIVENGEPFVYTSGKYPSAFEKTTVACALTNHPERQGVLVYDLRYDPTIFIDMSAKELAEAWQFNLDTDRPRLPIKTLQYNRCPAVAPLSVLDKTDARQLTHLQLNLEEIEANRRKLRQINHWPARILEALKIMNTAQEKRYAKRSSNVDSQLYDGFFDNYDKTAMSVIRSSEPRQIGGQLVDFKDSRLNKLLPLYKARNFPNELDRQEKMAWYEHCAQKLLAGGKNSQMARFKATTQELIKDDKLTSDQIEILKELEAYATGIKSIVANE